MPTVISGWSTGLNDGKGTGAAVYEFNSAQPVALAYNPKSDASFFVTSALTDGTIFNFPQFAAFDTAGEILSGSI